MAEHVRVEVVRECAECGALVENPTPHTWRWVHAGQEAGRDGGAQQPGHSVEPVRRCRDCKGPLSDWQDAWADYTGCTACGTETRYSLGD